MQEKVYERMLLREKEFSLYATKSDDAVRFKPASEDIRTPFFRDVDRILHSLSYFRYANKTQVFSFLDNDHISRRMVHVQFVSKIARTIGRALGLNEDLIEAGALGHDIGHTPLGHAGEAMLNEISLRELGEMFNHNVQSVRTYMYIERDGRGLNLTLQTLDAILCHNGEILSSIYEPQSKTNEEFLESYKLSYTDKEVLKKLRPMTLEGCVVRLSDLIGYIGRDVEDAINIGRIKRDDIPLLVREVLGSTNSEIINAIILDVIENSMDKPYIKMSDKVFEAIQELKKFNYEKIYAFALTEEEHSYYKEGMNRLFKKCLNDIENKNYDSDIYQVFLNDKNEDYLINTSSKRKVIDYIAGMTDLYFKRMIENI